MAPRLERIQFRLRVDPQLLELEVAVFRDDMDSARNRRGQHPRYLVQSPRDPAPLVDFQVFVLWRRADREVLQFGCRFPQSEIAAVRPVDCDGKDCLRGTHPGHLRIEPSVIDAYLRKMLIATDRGELAPHDLLKRTRTTT